MEDGTIYFRSIDLIRRFGALQGPVSIQTGPWKDTITLLMTMLQVWTGYLGKRPFLRLRMRSRLRRVIYCYSMRIDRWKKAGAAAVVTVTIHLTSNVRDGCDRMALVYKRTIFSYSVPDGLHQGGSV